MCTEGLDQEQGMIGKIPVLAAVVAVVTVYVAMPYVTLWEIAGALQRGDVGALQSSIDWDSVRSGLKADISEGIVSGVFDADHSAPQLASNTLPRFGASFISGIAGSVVDREVTPQHLAAMMRQLAPADPDAGFSMPLRGVEHAFFESPTSFLLTVRCPGQDPGDQPLRVRLEMEGGGWKVVRAWVSQDLVDLANSRT
jgi:hypothetical protein